MECCLIEATLIRAAEVRVYVRTSRSPWETGSRRGRSGLMEYREVVWQREGSAPKADRQDHPHLHLLHSPLTVTWVSWPAAKVSLKTGGHAMCV